MDLNQALQAGLYTFSLEQATELVAFSLQPEIVLKELKHTKRFDLLPAFLPILQLDLYPGRCEELVRIYAQCLVEEDRKSVEILDRHSARYFRFEKVAFYYGKLTKEDKLVNWAKHDYLNSVNYLSGLLVVDNLELYLQASNRWSKKTIKKLEERQFYTEASNHCAVKMMEHFGYTGKALEKYVHNCVCMQNLCTLEVLFAHVEDQTFFTKLVKEKIKEAVSFLGAGCFVGFMRVCLTRGWLTLSETEWEQLVKKNPELYQQLQADV